MEWVSVKNGVPDNSDEVFVCHNYEHIEDVEYSVAWYHQGNKKWIASSEMLVAENYDGSCGIELDNDVTHWTIIEGPK